MKKKIFEQLLDLLQGIDYFFISGMSVAIYSEGRRTPGDIDIAVHEKEIDRFAQLLGAKAERRFIHKGTFVVEDYGFVVDFQGQMIEVTSEYPKKRVSEHTFNRLFRMKSQKNYLGREVFVEPIEELLTQKAFMHRGKDIVDLRLLKNIPFDKKRVRAFTEDKGNNEEILKVLRNEQFEI